MLSLLLVAGAAAGAWSLLAPGATEEDRVRHVLDGCETAFEKGDVDGIVDHLHAEYSDSLGNDRAGADRYLKFLLVMQKKTYAMDRRQESIHVEGESAKIEFVASGSERRGEELLPSGLGTWDVTGEMRRVDGEWKIYRLELKKRRE